MNSLLSKVEKNVPVKRSGVLESVPVIPKFIKSIPLEEQYASTFGISHFGTYAYVGIRKSLSGLLLVVDLQKGSIVRRVEIDGDPVSLLVNPVNGLIYILWGTPEKYAVSVYEPERFTKIHEVSLVDYPVSMAISPEGSRLYVAIYSNQLLVIDTKTYNVLYEVDIGENISDQMIVSPDGGRVYFGIGYGTIALDTRSLSVVARSDVRNDGMVCSPDGEFVYVNDRGGNRVVSLAAKDLKLVASTSVNSPRYGIVASSDGKWLYASSESGMTVSVIDVKIFATQYEVPVTKFPYYLAISPSNEYVYTYQQTRDAMADFLIIDMSGR